MRWEQKVQYATLSDVGMRRRNNQDSFTVQLSADQEQWSQFGHLFVVCDGMGGHAVGELASKIGVDTIPLTFFKSRAGSVSAALSEAIEAANRAIHERGTQNRDFNRMGTTCVAVVLGPHGAVLGHVGDSRAYRVRGDRIEQLTFDHSLEWELQRAGRLKPGESGLPETKHVITRSLGPEPVVQIDINGPHVVFPGDRFVLCSDGLTGHVSDPEIGMIVRELMPAEASRLLVNLANLRGGNDNITVIVIQAGAVTTDTPASESSPPDDTSAIGPFWWLGFWLAVLVFGLGATLIVSRQIVAGGAFLGTGILGLALLAGYWLRMRKPLSTTDPDETVQASVYRAASARTTMDFLNGLMKLTGELRSLAVEQKWTANWNAHEAAMNLARQALSRKQAAKTLSELGKAIEPLMPGLHAYRRKARQEAGREQDQSDAD